MFKPGSSFHRTFMTQNTLQERQNYANDIRKRYPGRVPIIIAAADNGGAPELDNHKYIISNDTSMGVFMYRIRKELLIPETKCMFIFAGNTIVGNSSTMSQIYKKYRHGDGILYLCYCYENTFG